MADAQLNIQFHPNQYITHPYYSLFASKCIVIWSLAVILTTVSVNVP